MGKHQLFGSLAAVAVFCAPSIALPSDTEADLETALEQVYSGSRYDIVEASVGQCEIRLFIKDSDACSGGAAIQSHSYFYDLRHFQAELLDDFAKLVDGTWRFRVELTPIGDWATQLENVNADGMKRLEAARAKHGKGRTAVIEANKSYATRYDIAKFNSLGSTGYCPSTEVIGPTGWQVQLQGKDVEKLARSFETIVQSCKP
ncbi:hypothetical protein [Ruegeria halocynthiae]|uniref:hypothetical protein n=1 Tax=Ruegeria halocynthiae TaxID=985054 RepID=UPI0005608AB6|nr:hypothetical protein [Ruegeria halocynthiae]